MGGSGRRRCWVNVRSGINSEKLGSIWLQSRDGGLHSFGGGPGLVELVVFGGILRLTDRLRRLTCHVESRAVARPTLCAILVVLLGRGGTIEPRRAGCRSDSDGRGVIWQALFRRLVIAHRGVMVGGDGATHGWLVERLLRRRHT